MIPMEGRAGQTAWQTTSQEAESLPLELAGGILRIRYTFGDEQEYALQISAVNREHEDPIVETRLFAVDGDLFMRYPYKGDLHMHSCRSDGVESPAYVAGAGRRTGLDFLAITDHYQYLPSLEAIHAFRDVAADLRMYPGEEVHSPHNSVHIVNFGGRFSINEQFATAIYHDEVEALAERLTGLPSSVDRRPFAACLWCFEKIREAGGLGVFCHPSWVSQSRYDVPGYMVDLIFEEQPFDALELLGGYHPFEMESNALQIARYHEERARGKRIPIVGASDSHGAEKGELFGWYYSIVFAPSTYLDDLVSSIKDLYSVAIEQLPNAPVRAYGPYRLVRYTQYLLREVIPLHDELCVEEGRLMLAYLAGDEDAAGSLRLLSGQTGALYEHLWDGGRPGEG
jgi:hypothetical protein